MRKITIFFATVALIVLPSILCFADTNDNKEAGEYKNIEELAEKKIGVQVGAVQEKYARQYIKDPVILYFDAYSDMPYALVEKKIDAFIVDENCFSPMKRALPNIVKMEKPLLVNQKTIFVTKQKTNLYDEMNSYLDNIDKNGELKEYRDRWFEGDELLYDEYDLSLLPNINGELKVAVDPTIQPYCFMFNNKVVGLDMNIIYNFCKTSGYSAKTYVANLSAMLAGVNAGTYDIGIGGMSWTEERAQKVLLTRPYVESAQVVVVRSTNLINATESNYIDSLKDSFIRNIISEKRWQLILSGLLVTIIITLLSAIFGTILGFILCRLRLSHNLIFENIVIILVKLVQGIPVVVLLMVLYYVIFAKSDISAIVVGIIGFSINFAVYVSEILRTGILAVEYGQSEAAYALGFTNLSTFWLIVFPQALRHALPIYKGEFVSMLKLTSIVGYIAVQDITKVSDIIRARTFDAFFPLIITALIYLILSYILTSLLSLVEISIDPKKRKNVLKGVDLVAAEQNINVNDFGINAKTANEPNVKNKDIVINLSHIKKSFPNVTPIKDITADIYSGDVIAVIGPSGTGKSTLLRCINGLDEITEGAINVLGMKLDKNNLLNIRKRVGFIFQSFNLFSHLTVIENLMLAPIKIDEKSKQEAYENGMRLLNKVGLADKALSYPSELSGGQKQRVAIVRGLAMTPDIILFDEPTSALDPTMVGEVLTVINGLAKSGLTMMIVTHEMKFARKVSNRVFYLDKGIIWEDGTSEQIFEYPVKEETKAFVNKFKYFKYEIPNIRFDFVELITKLNNWAHKELIDYKFLDRLMHCIEEIVMEGLIKSKLNSFPASLIVEYSDESKISIILKYEGEKVDISVMLDEISKKIYDSVITSSDYNYDGINIINIRIN